MQNNHCEFIGNLGRDPEIKMTPGGHVYARFSLAVSRKFDGKEYTDWIPVIAWGDMAEAAGNKFSKGMRIKIIGRFTSSSYIGKDGKKRYSHEITAEAFFLPVYKNDSTNHGSQQEVPSRAKESDQTQGKGDFQQYGVVSDPYEDVPF